MSDAKEKMRSRLQAVGQRLATSRSNTDIATTEAKEATDEALGLGLSEASVARELGVSRMTVRAWVGK